MATAKPQRPCLLIIRDGWGTNPHPAHDAFNAVRLAKTPAADALMRDYPWTLIKTSGQDVGLPAGTMGNSEVGHQNIGAGRVVPQESLVMSTACAAGLEKIPAIRAAIERVRESSGGGKGGKGKARTLHLLGIASDAGVHGQLEHLYAILRACAALGLRERVCLHLFTDGRDTGPFTGKGFLAEVEAQCRTIGVGRIASLCGRYYAMDRDHRWERVRLAYELLSNPAAPGTRTFASAGEAIDDYYARPTNHSQQGDEFVTPRRVGAIPAVIADGDSVIFFNYRGDRPRELSAAFVFPDPQWKQVKPSPDTGVAGFDRGRKLDVHFVTMTQYWEALEPFVAVAFRKPPKMVNIAGEWMARRGLRQFRCAETEKYPHVTFFFNDYRDEPFAGENRVIVQSPQVATYDLAPAMSAPGVRDAVLARLRAGDTEDLLIVNFANADMVGHTGKLSAAIAACEAVDACTGALVEAAHAKGIPAIVFADHGNAEQMWDPTANAPHTAHTLYDVPCIVADPLLRGRPSGILRGDQDPAGWFDENVRSHRGRLADVLPTALGLMGVDQPAEMTGSSLLR